MYLRQYQPNSYAVPFGYRTPTLGDFTLDPTALLASVTSPASTFSVSSPLLTAGLALLGAAIAWHYVSKASKKVKRYTRQRAQKSRRREQLKAELATL